VPVETRPAVILVVADEDAVNELITRYLRHLGYRVLEVASAAEALDVVQSRRPRVDMVLSDLSTPDLDGVTLAGRILARCPGPSVILMSRRLTVDSERLRINGQIVPILRKPLDLDRLQSLLRVTLEGFPENADDLLHLAG
jgi:DNA-binding NtrC family response regulator